MIVLIDNINNCSSSPIAEANITLTSFARNTTGSNPDISSEGIFLANADEW